MKKMMNKKVLLVSTDAVILETLNEKLSGLGFKINATSSPETLFTEIKNYQPDFLIVDFILDEANGGALCHQVKSNPETRELPVLILSEYGNLERFAPKFGCTAIINKIQQTATLIKSILAAFAEEEYSFVF